jgi:DNA-directed RNA polymerase subunit RPC12/RpoP
MPIAICGDCAAETHWRNQRGVRLADLRCSSCGHSGCLNAAAWDSTEGRYVIRDYAHSAGLRGGRFVKCSYCSRRRLEKRDGRGIWRPPVRVRLARYRDGRDAVTIEAGHPLCAYWHVENIVGECNESDFYPCIDRVLGHEVSP